MSRLHGPVEDMMGTPKPLTVVVLEALWKHGKALWKQAHWFCFGCDRCIEKQAVPYGSTRCGCEICHRVGTFLMSREEQEQMGLCWCVGCFKPYICDCSDNRDHMHLSFHWPVGYNASNWREDIP